MTLQQPDAHVHFIDCGQGNMTLIVTPDDSVLLYDCRVTEENKDDIIGHLRDYIPERSDPHDNGAHRQWIDWFICSHRDQDHIHGLQTVNAEFPVRGIVDPGMASGSTEGAENEYYMGLRLRVREAYGPQALIEPAPVSHEELWNFGGMKVYFLCSGDEPGDDRDGHFGNNVVLIEYVGIRVLMTGDSDWKSWREKIVPRFRAHDLISSTILVASHHGSRSFFTDSSEDGDEEEQWEEAYFEHLDLIKPHTTVISVGAQEIHNHPNSTALEHYRKRTTNKDQVYLTRDKRTLIARLHSDGTWHLTPSRFLRKWRYKRYSPPGKSLALVCTIIDRDGKVVGTAKSGDRIKIGHRLSFSVETTSGLRADMSKTSYVFEVSNGGIGRDQHHKEIYYKSKQESGDRHAFERDVSYVGIHLLRCRIYQKGAGNNFEAQTVFVVEGIP